MLGAAVNAAPLNYGRNHPSKFSMAAKFTIKQILLSNQNWWNFYNKNQHKIRPSITSCIIKLLSCKNTVLGYKEYHCSNQNCYHVKHIHFTCKCKACSSCGKKSTELWIEKQNSLLPNTEWQHITFTMPQELWDFFWLNRSLLRYIAKIAAKCIKKIAKKKKVIPGIFIAIHTFGRDLKRNVHIHLSTTTGGITEDGTQWKKLYFDQKTLMKMWRYEIIKLFRTFYEKSLFIPNAISKRLNNAFTFNQFLDALYNKHWVVYCSKPSSDYKVNVNYLARYIKRPAIAESKLKHYDGHEVTFKYLDHTSKTYRKFKLTAEQFIARLIQHIPDTGFRMIRYYGFLAQRIRGTLLPKVYTLLGQIPETRKPPSHAELIQKNFGFDPLTCILCGQKLLLSRIQFGTYRTSQLLQFHQGLALFQKI